MAALIDVHLNYCEEFKPEKKLMIEMGKRIATTAGKERDLVFQFCLAGEDKNPQISNECSETLQCLVSI